MRLFATLLCSTVALLAGLSAPARASVTAGYAFAAVQAPHPLGSEPTLNEPAWQAGAIALHGGFMDLTTRKSAPLATAVWLLYDTNNLYIAFRCEQPGVSISASQTTNGVGFGLDDFVGVGIDTSGDGTQVYYFETTPRGVRYEQASENARYRPVWKAAARVAGSQWSAVLIVPLRILRIRPGSPQSWRVNFIRGVAATGEHYTWAYDGLMQDGPAGEQWPDFGAARFWPTLTGIRVGGLHAHLRRPRAQLYLLDSLGPDRNRFAQADGSFAPQRARNAGVDLTVPLTPTITFVGTLAPDFSNVEVDQQTIAPQEFRRGLREYRPFFAQGAKFIDANPAPFGTNGPPDRVFYSPDVGPFDRGAKIEGTFGNQAFGVLNFRGYDRTTGNTFDDTAYGYAHELPDRTFGYWADGVFAHHSLAGDDTTTEFGLGGRNLRNGFVYALDRSIERGSWVPGAIARSTNGFVDVHKPNYELNIGYADLSPNYNPIDGFTTNSDLHGWSVFSDVSGAARGVKNFFVFLNGDRFFDRSGAVHQADSGLFLNAAFKNRFSIDGAGPAIGELRSYATGDPAAYAGGCAAAQLPRSYFTGYPSYRCGRTDLYNLFTLPLGYDDGTPTPVDVSLAYGRFGGDELHLYTFASSRPVGRIFSLGMEYDATFERPFAGGVPGAQFLRRLSLQAALGADADLTLSVRSVNGLGGFVPVPGTNVSFAFYRRFENGDELFLNYGTPAAYTTLDRFIVKYLFHLGGDAGV